jgi:hypothetical protein
MKHVLATLAALLSLGVTAAHAEEPHSHHAQAPAGDSRVMLELTPGERAMILEEMRQFLGGVQKMTGALARQDMQDTAEAARGIGQKMVHEVPPALRAKLPVEFRQLGFSVHREFDQIAMDAESLKDVGTTLSQLSATLQKCVSCHATYQIRTPAPDARH